MKYFTKLTFIIAAFLGGCNQANFGSENTIKDGKKGSSDGPSPQSSEALGTSSDGVEDRNADAKNTAELKNKTESKTEPLAIDETSRCINQPLKTQVKLLTALVANGTPGNNIKYQIAIVDCEGRLQPLSGQDISFDLDAEVDESVTNNYSATAGTEALSGTLNVVDGQDLFGNVGDDFFHHKTDRKFKTSEKKIATLTIELMGQTLFPLNDDQPLGAFTVKTYLKFGSASAVVQPVLVGAVP